MKHIFTSEIRKGLFFSLFNLYWIFSNFIAAKTIYLSTLLVGVRICGSTIVKHAFTEARQRPGGINLGLERLQAHIWWQGKSGMLASQLPKQIRIMLQFEDPPSYLVVHVGGNDIGKENIGYLRNNLKLFLRTIQRKLPNTIIVWSHILPRRSYRFFTNNKAMEKCRYRLNNSIA